MYAEYQYNYMDALLVYKLYINQLFVFSILYIYVHDSKIVYYTCICTLRYHAQQDTMFMHEYESVHIYFVSLMSLLLFTTLKQCLGD